jgi:thioredoxin 1
MASDKITHADDASFQADVLDSDLPVLVDFWAVWCGPCRAIAPHLEVLAEELHGQVKIVKVDVDKSQQVAAAYGIRSIPTLLVFKRGQVVDQMVGNPGSKSKIAELVTRHVA